MDTTWWLLPSEVLPVQLQPSGDFMSVTQTVLSFSTSKQPVLHETVLKMFPLNLQIPWKIKKHDNESIIIPINVNNYNAFVSSLSST